jgi:glycosyltransferase involved in cell wall biosynthesis
VSPIVTVVIPCFNEAGFIDPLLTQLVAQIGDEPRWGIVVVDDSSTDDTPHILDTAASRANGRIRVVRGRYGSPGAARSAGVAAACASHRIPDWIVTIDADVMLGDAWFRTWDTDLHTYQSNDEVGAVNGVEVQEHLFAHYPNAKTVSAAFGHALVRSESLVGITNLNGVNHGIRTCAYDTAGPYLQPTAPGPNGPLSLAGEDWDLGVRLRRAGFTIHETSADVIDRGRRLLTDVHAYVSGEAYEGAFMRLPMADPSSDIDPDTVSALVDSAIERSLRHFFLKPILADTVALDARTGLSEPTIDRMCAWMIRWPHPTIDESRNGFIFGRLARFSDAFSSAVRADLGLTLPDVLNHVSPAKGR